MEKFGANIAIGTDIVDVRRVRTAIEKFGNIFLAKIFTEAELAYCVSAAATYCSLSARFAAKEAFSKAIGTGIGIGSALKWHDVAVQNQPIGIPKIILTPKATGIMKQHGFKIAKVSLSHTKTLAQAVVILIG
jgi:holo-[acyl-carrier protein] synthase